ncbi:hypothetical protein M885DRAFT_4852 [Pelagophyceae sp. CCMP2097]|nr:hypothetical protein M885DRAFT_4852 [Pelagophyceae sp. CCMP2097]
MRPSDGSGLSIVCRLLASLHGDSLRDPRHGRRRGRPCQRRGRRNGSVPGPGNHAFAAPPTLHFRFLHLHLGIRGDGLPTEPSEAFPAQWATVSDWTIGIDAPRNLVLVSVPSLLDPSLAPTGSHVVHAYVPATEPWADWEAEDYPSKSYREKKKAAVEVLFAAIEKYIPDVRSRVDLEFAATPRTHARFLRREKGTYGAFLPAQKDTTEMLMGHKTPLPGFYVCGDSTFPGIGVPAVAASGLITAHSILSPQEHWANLDKIKIFP